jgi:long-chain acyl-CoA synthetase
MAAGGAALAPETQLLWEGLGIRVVQGYGTSECSPVVACGSGDGSAPVGSVGRPLPGVEVRLAADGELLVHGPNVMRGYWKDPGHTAEVLHDGWYSTGDLARIDEEGNLWITGRARDLIVLPSGMNLWPQDVEEVLRAHEAVKDAAVIPVPTPSGGLTLHAHVIPAGLGADLNAVVASCNTRLAPHQRVATASWWPEADFPRTSTLKVRRALLPQPEEAGTVKLDGLRTDDDPVGQAVAGIARTGAVRGDQTLAELGLDSLGMVELAVSLEAKTGKLVGDGDLQLPMTVQQIRDLLATAPELDGAGTGHAASSEPPMWPYTWGRALRPLAAPITLLYRCAVTHTTILGREHLGGLGHPVIFAGTHHGFADMSLVHHGLAHSPARHLARRLVAATAATELEIGRVRIGGLGLGGWYGILAFGLFPLQRTRGQEASLRQLARIGEAGNAILIFPQGAHARPQQERDGDPLARFRPGVAHLAAALSARVVPFGVAGTDLIIPPMREDFHGPVIAGVPVSITRGPLAIAFGAPLSLQPGETPDAFTARLQDESYRLTRLAEEALTPRGIPSRAKG